MGIVIVIVIVIMIIILMAIFTGGTAEDAKKRLEELRKSPFMRACEAEHDRVEKEVKKITSPHMNILAKKYQQLVYKDDYGKTKFDQFERELKYFLHEFPILYNKDLLDEDDIITMILWEVMDYDCDKLLDENNPENQYSEDMDPYAYEHYCSKLLQNRGWETQVTKKSGDQGVDVIALKDNKIFVVQCKKSSTPVGNKAVQEVYAAKDFHKATMAAVVSNNTFTVSAKQLASNLQVMLLHHSELTDIN